MRLSLHAGAVAHGVHSMTLEDVRYYFRSDASAQNGIPSLNYDLSDDLHPVLRNAPASGYDTSFSTIAMQHVDQVRTVTRGWIHKFGVSFKILSSLAEESMNDDALHLVAFRADCKLLCPSIGPEQHGPQGLLPGQLQPLGEARPHHAHG